MSSLGFGGDIMAERLFATREGEPLKRRRFKAQTKALLAVFEWIEGWYNPHCRHSSLGYVLPVNYERTLLTTATGTVQKTARPRQRGKSRH
jgi:putative transposase